LSDAGESIPAKPAKGAAAYRTIGEVAEDLDVPAHVLRFWETKFEQLKPLKRGGGRRYYRPEDVMLLRRIRQCLYEDGYTIRGVQQLLSGSNWRADPEPAQTLFPLDPPPPARGLADDAGPVSSPRRPSRPGGRTKPDRPDRAALEALRDDLAEARKLLDQLLPRKTSD